MEIIMKLLLTFLTLVMFSFNANSEVINLKLLCRGEITIYKDEKKAWHRYKLHNYN